MLKAGSAETQYLSQDTERVKKCEQKLYDMTGKGIVHPNEFAEIYVRQQVEKLFIKKYGSSK
jgi:hypothetical protein